MTTKDCAICQKSFVRLPPHVLNMHDMDMKTYEEYKKQNVLDCRQDLELDDNSESELDTESSNESETSEPSSEDDESDSKDMGSETSEPSSEDAESDPKDTDSEMEAEDSGKKNTFFEQILEDIENKENLTEVDLLSLLAKNTVKFLNLRNIAKDDIMLKKICKLINKYLERGLQEDEAIATTFEKETAFFNKLISRVVQE